MTTAARSLTILSCMAIALAAPVAPSLAQSCSTDHDPATHTKVGQSMPAVSVLEPEGQTFSLAAERGKIVVINFWATWCGPCQLEIPRLEKEVWQRYKSDPDFRMIAIAREQTAADIVPFQKKLGFTYAIAADPRRSTYAVFADSGIPRTYVVGVDGRILFQTVGYCPEDFKRMEKVIVSSLRDTHATHR